MNRLPLPTSEEEVHIAIKANESLQDVFGFYNYFQFLRMSLTRHQE